MQVLPVTEAVEETGLSYTYCLDLFSDRIRLDDYYGDIQAVLEHFENKGREFGCGKWIVKCREEDRLDLVRSGYQQEATVDRYFLGSHMHFFVKYTKSERRNSDVWAEGDELLRQIRNGRPSKKTELAEGLSIRLCHPGDAAALAALYAAVFPFYPVPMDRPEYITKCMEEGAAFFLACFKGDLPVSVVCGDVDRKYRNAEVTDCATLPDFRQYGLMRKLIEELEKVLYTKNILCAYTIARSMSYGMNAAFYRLGYTYRGRMANNCIISTGLEDMNVWVKILEGPP